jgi:hypothetical protein
MAETPNRGAIPTQVVDTIQQVTALLGPVGAIVASVMGAVRAIRAANPGVPLPSDGEIFLQLIAKAELGQAEIAEVRGWLRTLPGWEEPAEG